MNFIFSRVFWGTVLILFGIGLFAERVYGINLPLWGIFWSLLIIWIGISLLFPRDRWFHDEKWRQNMKKGDVIFEDNVIDGDDETSHYNVVFSQSEIDLTKLKPLKGRPIKVDVIFGTGVLKINKDTPIRIKATSVFGEVKLPNGDAASFGDAYYESSNYDSKKPYISIKANTIFGTLNIKTN